MTENLHLVVPLIALAAGMVFVLFDAGIGRKRKMLNFTIKFPAC